MDNEEDRRRFRENARKRRKRRKQKQELPPGQRPGDHYSSSENETSSTSSQDGDAEMDLPQGCVPRPERQVTSSEESAPDNDENDSDAADAGVNSDHDGGSEESNGSDAADAGIHSDQDGGSEDNNDADNRHREDAADNGHREDAADNGHREDAASSASDGDGASSSSNAAESEEGEYAPSQPSDNSEESEEEGVGDVSDSNEEAASDDDAENDDGNMPIYPGAPLTLHESLLAIFTLMSVEHLSKKLLGLILQLLVLHCPDGSLLKKTVYTFKAYFIKIGSCLIVFHYYCSNCVYPVKSKQSICKNCKKGGDNISYFLELSLFHQLQKLFLKQGFFQDLQFRFKPDRKKHQNSIDDIYDGRIYKEQMANGFLSSPFNLSFMWYTDGVSIFHSSSFSIWPLCLVINELPYKKRTKTKNILLVGVWFGKSKPSPNIFLRPLLKTMEKFERDGFAFKLANNAEVRVRGKILCGTCDLPAKCKMLNMKQYNGAYGCSRCMEEGGRAVVGGTTVQVYPYQANVRHRTHQETEEYAAQALVARARNKDASVFGVKGPTLFSKLVPDLIRCTAIDIMHGVFLGVFKTVFGLWFSSAHSTQPWTLHHLEAIIDEKLAKVKPPSSVVRAPRLLRDLKFWKAAEYKLFMLYYSVIILKGVMDDVYFKHHCLLVSAIALLSQDSISLDQIDAASAMLRSYVCDFARLYPLRYLGINVHQLLHLGDSVLDLGPCFVFSCFFLENFNGYLNKFFHGTQHVAFQICSSVSMFMKVPSLMSSLAPHSKALSFCEAVEAGPNTFKLADVIDNVTNAVGTYSRNTQQVNNSMHILEQSLNIVNGTCRIFFRLQKSGVMYFAKEYGVVSKRYDSTYVTYLSGDTFMLGQIIRFVRWSDCGRMCDFDCQNCPVSYFAIIRVYERQLSFIHDMPNIRLPYISKVEPTQNIVAVRVQTITGFCFCIQTNDGMFLIRQVNRLEIE